VATGRGAGLTPRAFLLSRLQDKATYPCSYAQYLADKSKNRVLLHKFRSRRESVEGRFYQVQWAEGDFRAVAQAFDQILGGYGWLR